jgi:hypothetical protein
VLCSIQPTIKGLFLEEQGTFLSVYPLPLEGFFWNTFRACEYEFVWSGLLMKGTWREK